MSRAAFRLIGIGTTLARYRLDDLLDLMPGLRALRWLRAFVPAPRGDIATLPRGARLRLALQDLGPLFVKFGQILSTRRDLLPEDIATELALLQDRVAPFPGDVARSIVERELGLPIAQAFARFDAEPLASASIAQVHAATLPDGTEVVVKVLRPGIEARIDADLALLNAMAALFERHAASRADKLQPREIVAELERTLRGEVDLQREGANASLLRRHFEGSPDLYVPRVHWEWSKQRVLTLERVHGIPSDNLEAIDAAGIDRVKLAEKGVRLFYTQVFRDNFFHADAHPGNIWVDTTRTDEPRFIALDFGIMGSLPDTDLRHLAENFRAMFERDYRRVAELHLEAGWMPPHVRIDELEAAVRSICEPYFTRPLAEVSIGEIVVKLFRIAHRYELTIQPQLLLLQKTLLNVEGVGRLLHPKLDIWAVAQPVLADLMAKRYGLNELRARFRDRLPEMLEQAPELPRLLHRWLEQAAAGEARSHIRSEDLRRLADVSERGQRRVVWAVIGAALLIAATLLYALESGGARWFGQPVGLWVALVGGVLAFAAALRGR